MKEHKIKIPLEVILPEILKNQIEQSIGMFIKGITWHIDGTVNYKWELGSIELTGNVAVKDDYIFVLICQIVEEYYGIPLNKILVNDRKRYICEKRQILQTLALKYTKLPRREIARRTGKKDHAVIYHAEKTILNLIATNQRIAMEYNDIDERIKAKLNK